MKTSDLIFIGIRGSVVAVDRGRGQEVWSTRLKGWNFVNVVLENGALLATSNGEIFCLDPLTGRVLWHNPLKGYGTGLATIATENNPNTSKAAVLAEKKRRDEQAASGAAASVAACG
jgi:outer membrane protein assembly factor BamB